MLLEPATRACCGAGGDLRPGTGRPALLHPSHTQRNPLPVPVCAASGWGTWRAGLLGASELLVRSPASGGVAWAVGGNGLLLFQLTPGTLAPGHPHGTLSTQTQCLQALPGSR